MNETLLRIKNKILGTSQEEDIPDEFGEDYLEIDSNNQPARKSKVVVKPFIIKEFQDVKQVLDALRDGYTIALVNIRPIKEKDMIELKRVVNKLKKTCDAVDGDIAGFGEDWLVATPNFATVDRSFSKAGVSAQVEVE
ncbi:cell division protein SepF [Candidatus Woesearchaeota archaeon]|nr:cell division protein SepF [Candidatus Woesearchaeota archaeon]